MSEREGPNAHEIPQQAEQAPTLRDPERRRQMVDAATVGSDWTPDSIATDAAEVKAALAKAANALKDGRLEQGDGNALSLYISILKTQPKNAEALAGMDAVAARLLEKGRASLAADQLDAATQVGRALAHIRPMSADVQTFESEVKRGQEIRMLLLEGERLLNAGELINDQADSAVSAYQEVLKLDSANAAARSGLLTVEANFVDAAIKAADDGDYARADQLLADAALVETGSGAVLDASTRIVEMRQVRAASIVEQANERIQARDLHAASRLLLELESVSAQAEGIEDVRNRIENARVYGGFRPGQVMRDLLQSGASSPALVVIPAGHFQMGSKESEQDRRPNEGPTRTVIFERGFAVAVHETSVAEFRAFIKATGHQAASAKARSSTVYDEKSGSMTERRGISWESDFSGNRAADVLPVVHVAWSDANAYAQWLAKETGEAYRLPSEAEFEYVLRAGSSDRFPWGDESPMVYVGNLTGDGDRSASRRTWVNAFKDYSDGYWGPAPVGQFDANAFGAYDFVGNVSEWVDDCWHDSYQRAPKNGAAWVNPGCDRRVIRGASWGSAPDQVRSAFRLNADPESTNARLGFRVARDLD